METERAPRHPMIRCREDSAQAENRTVIFGIEPTVEAVGAQQAFDLTTLAVVAAVYPLAGVAVLL
jgi:hypothetical protein